MPSPSAALRTALAALDRAPRAWLLAALIGLQILIHAPFLGRPPSGIHLWRQTQTLSVARNFFEEGMNPLRPRVDSRGGGSGVTGMEFPLVNLAVAAGYSLFGFSHAAGRIVLLGFSLAAVVACFALLEERFGSRSAAAVGTLLLLCSPMFAYYSITAVPEIAALAFLLGALLLLERGVRARSRWHLPASLSLLGLAGLVKITSLLVLPLVLWRLWSTVPAGSSRLRRLGGLALAVGAVGSWYLYARGLSLAAANHDFKLRSAFPYPLHTVPGPLKAVFLQWLPEFYLTYGAFALFLVGLALALRGARSRQGDSPAYEAWYALGAAALIVAELPMLDAHDYYLIPVLPLLVMVAVRGWSRLSRADASSRGHAIAVLLLAAAIVLGPARGLNRFVKDPPRPDLIAVEACLDRVVPERSTRVIAAADKSPSIYLYFMHRKGWSVTDGVRPGDFDLMVRDGAAYLVSDSRALEARPEIAAYLGEARGQCSSFRVYPLAIPEAGRR
jgi:hypothetical protein